VQDGDYIMIEAGSTASSMMQFLHQSNLTILTNGLLDSSKFGLRSLVQVMALDEVDTIVTDAGAPPDIVTDLKSRGIDIRIADE
jgi:DeoR/GlpR family transcriptional regulator of sugar metabolism